MTFLFFLEKGLLPPHKAEAVYASIINQLTIIVKMISNLILLTGKDTYRLHERVKFYEKSFREKFLNGEVEQFSQEHSLREVVNTVLTPSLFGEKRCVILEEFWNAEKFEEAEKNKFFEALSDFTDQATIFVIEPSLDKRLKFSKFLLKNAKVETFDPLDEMSLHAWIKEFVKKRNRSIPHQESNLLLHRCGENLWNLSRELEKLSMATDTEITKDLIMQLTIPHPKAIIWEFTEKLSKKNVHESLRALRELLYAGESIHQIFAMIIREVRIHAQLRSALDQHISADHIASMTKLHPFVIKKTIPLTKNFSMPQIEGMYERLFQIDKKMKTGGISVSTDDNSELVLAVEKFIVESCR